MGKRIRVLFILLLVIGAFALIAQRKELAPKEGRTPGLNPGRQVAASTGPTLVSMKVFVEREIRAGHLRLFRTQTEERGGYVHRRFEVYHQGVKVWGAQVIDHQRDGETYHINGHFHDDIRIPVVPTVDAAAASRAAFRDLVDPVCLPHGDPELLILPLDRGYVLAYEVFHYKSDAYWHSFVDAHTGEIIFKYNDIQPEAGIGLGQGTFGDYKKLSVEYTGSAYVLKDLMRPGQLVTANMWNGEDINKTYYMTDDDNFWTDPIAVDAHAHIGWTYDYFKLVFDRNGMDGANTPLVVSVHFGKNYSNAFFHNQTKWLYFGDGDPSVQHPYTAALDIVAHEFTHGVTQSTSGLVYWYDSGALNEALSDILGVSCEFFHQPVGYGYQMADWWEGEDTRKNFDASRDLSNPARIIWYPPNNWAYPDHMSKYYDFRPYNDYDNGGVHINMTIASHWYYLLANGGTNRTSGLSVSGIGLSKAEQIAYRGWVYYLTPTSGFAHARQATIQAANDLYGAGSAESGRVGQAWAAVGVY